MPQKRESWNCSATIVTYLVTLEKTVLTWFDVRMMSMDELQEVLENRMALLDVAPSDPPRLPEVSPEIAEAMEDFPHNDE